MKTLSLGTTDVTVSALAYGCWRLTRDRSTAGEERGRAALRAALDAGFTTFDHADIYGTGASEKLFGDFVGASNDDLVIVTKCGIVFADDAGPKRYDLRAQYIEQQVEASLKRLQRERIDVLLLHRPDFLMQPDDVAMAFGRLSRAGKVTHFGVSNFSPSQVELLAAACEQPLVANQVEINVVRLDALTDGTLDQCQRLGITPQAWSPLAGVAYPSGDDDADERVKQIVHRQAERHGVEAWLIPLAWLMRHPATIQPIVGTTTPTRVTVAAKAADIDYSREDWYELLEAASGTPVP